MEMREVETDEGGEHAEANAPERKYGAVRSDLPENMRKGEMPGGRDRHSRQTESKRDGGQRDGKNYQARGRKTTMLLKQNTERSAYGEGGECGDTIQEMTLAMC